MADVNSTNRVPFGAIAAYGFVQFATSLRDRIVVWNDSRTTRNALNRLSDRELADIGLTRADVERVAAGNWR